MDGIARGELPDPAIAAGYRLDEHADCAPPPGGCPPPPFDRKNAVPVGLWSQRIRLDAVLALGRDARIDLDGVVLAGLVALERDEAPAVPLLVGPWQAFRAPGAGVRLRARGVVSGSAHLVLAVATRGGPVSGWLAGRPMPWPLRPGVVATVDLGARAPLSWAGGKAHARLGFEHGLASFGLLLGAPDAPVPPHRHDGSWEVIGLLRARGAFHREAGPGADASASFMNEPGQSAEDGAIVSVPPGVAHAWTPAGDRPLLAVQLYAPPGPEQRFKDLAAKAR
jgi:hypothetical protein